MVGVRNTRSDVVAAAGRLFAEQGYHGTSMRELGRELGLLGSSLYSHVDSKQDLLVEVVAEGARLFEAAAQTALSAGGRPSEQLRRLIAGHVAVVLDNLDVARTFLNEARMLDSRHRAQVLEARDRYEAVFRSVVAAGVEDGDFREDVDPKVATIFALSILNAIERWFRADGALNRDDLVDELAHFVLSGIS
ncbi:MAG: TetR/AcrR family transcriptional regulator [Acidimicrobiia bacterium]|nr:TetR/AcrR family transcriptional regulator [Acidimicrobiia bacterium]